MNAQAHRAEATEHLIANELAQVLYERLKAEDLWHPILRSINATTRVAAFDQFCAGYPNPTPAQAKATAMAREIAQDAELYLHGIASA